MHVPSLCWTLVFALMSAAPVAFATPQQLAGHVARAHADSPPTCSGDKLVLSQHQRAAVDSSSLDPSNIAVLNWNIYKGRREDWAYDFQRYSRQQDIVMIQEAQLGTALTSLLDQQQYWTLNAAYKFGGGATGVLTASSVSPAFVCGQRTTEPVIRTPKTSLISYYPLAGVSEYLLVANVHGINFTIGLDAYAAQIEQLYDIIKHHDGPVVLAGDFNTWNDQRLRIVQRMVSRLSLESLDYTNHNRTSVFGNALDHVFYRGLEPIEHDTWQVTSSDHNPTRVSFRLNRYYLPGENLANVIDGDNC